MWIVINELIKYFCGSDNFATQKKENPSLYLFSSLLFSFKWLIRGHRKHDQDYDSWFFFRTSHLLLVLCAPQPTAPALVLQPSCYCVHNKVTCASEVKRARMMTTILPPRDPRPYPADYQMAPRHSINLLLGCGYINVRSFFPRMVPEHRDDIQSR